MGYGNQTTTKESQQETEGLYAILQKTLKKEHEMKTFRQVIENMALAPKGKGREAAKKLYKEDDLEEVSPAQRRARKHASLLKTMAKYGLARKMGIPASQVNQRRSHPTRKKA